MRAKDGTIRYARIAADSASWVTRLVIVVFSFVAAIGLFLLERRIVGELDEPLRALPLLATAAIVAAVIFLLCERTDHSNSSLSLSVGLVLVFAVACSYPGNRFFDWLVWSAASAAAFAPSIIQRLRSTETPNPTSIRVADVVDLEADGDAEKVLQNLTRVRTAEGHDAIRGTLVAEFEPGARQTTLHIAFCPPFERLPEIDANLVDDSDAELKLTQAFHHGAQFEVRLPEAAEESLSVEFEFYATDAGAE
jgi:hypothetical protein